MFLTSRDSTMNNNELVSVIVPVYNIKDYLSQCLNSISNQTYCNLEIILIDDGSDDGSEHMCDAFAETDSRAKVIHNPHQGLWAARNAGQVAATGEYLFFPDGDDYFHRDMIQILYSAINLQGNEYPLALCNIKRTGLLSEDVTSSIIPSLRVLSKDELIRGLVDLDEDRFGAQWNKLYRKSQLFLPVNRCYSRFQDGDSNLRFYLQINNAVLVDDVLYYYYQHERQLIKVSNYWYIRYKCEIQIFTRIIEELTDENREYAHSILNRLYKRMIEYKGSSYNTQRYRDALELCNDCENKTRTSFLSCRQIPLYKRLLFVFLLRHVRFTHFLMRLTNNI